MRICGKQIYGGTNTMISIRNELSELETMSARSSAAIDAYRYAVECDAEYAAPAKGDETIGHQNRLAEILAVLGASPRPEDLERNRTLLRAELRDYSETVRKYYDDMKKDLHRLQQSVSDLLGAAGQHMGDQESRLNTEITRLNGVLQLDDVAALRRELTAAIASLEQASQEMKLQNRAMVTEYRAEIRALQSWTAEAVTEAKRDALTGFATRAEFERQIGVRVTGGRKFAIVYVLLVNAKSLIRQRGKPGEEVVSSAAKRTALVIDSLRCGRWSDDEFVLLCDTVDDSLTVSKTLSLKLSGEYLCRDGATNLLRLNLTVRIGVAQCFEMPDTAAVIKKIEELARAFAS